MDGARSGDDRLPWLDAPRPAKPAATRRAHRPLFILLGLFFAGAIAVMAYVTGRGTAPVTSPAPASAPVALTPVPVAPRAPVPAPPQAPAPTAIQAAPVAAPAPAVPTPAPVRVASAEPRAAPAKAKRDASTRRPSPNPAPRRPERAVVQPEVARTPTPPIVSAVPPRRTTWPAQPFAGPRGRVIQLGAYRTQARADAAWWRLARRYPYLTSLPRMVVWTGPTPGRARIYRVRLAAGSSGEARALCRNLHRIGRGCAVV